MYCYCDIALRPIERKDLEFLRVMHNDFSTVSQLHDSHMLTEKEQENWFEKVSQSKSSERLAVLVRGKIVGCVRFDMYDPVNRSLQVGGDIHPSFRGMGYGKQMIEAYIKYAFDVKNCHRIYLLVLETNKVALGLYKKCGMLEEGRATESIFRDGKWLDCICMYMTEDNYRGLECASI